MGCEELGFQLFRGSGFQRRGLGHVKVPVRVLLIRVLYYFGGSYFRELPTSTAAGKLHDAQQWHPLLPKMGPPGGSTWAERSMELRAWLWDETACGPSGKITRSSGLLWFRVLGFRV